MLSSDSSDYSSQEMLSYYSSDYSSEDNVEYVIDYEYDSETGLPASFRNGRLNGEWKTNVTESILYRGGVMHFPNSIGRDIPEMLFTIPVTVKRTRRSYDMELNIATRNFDEKSLAGESWRDFLVEQDVAVGDVLEWHIQSHPIACEVEIRRVGKCGKMCAEKGDAKKKVGSFNGAKKGGSKKKGGSSNGANKKAGSSYVANAGFELTWSYQ